MTIGLIAYYLGPCLGIGQYLQRILPPLIEELDNRNVEVRIFASPNAFENTVALQELCERVLIIPPLDYSPTKRYLWCATYLTHYCQKESLKCLLWLSNPLVLPWHPPTLAVIHDVNEWKIPTKYRDRLKTILRSMIYLDSSIFFANKIIAISKATEKDLLYFRPNIDTNKLKTIVNGSDSQLVNLPSVSIPAPETPFLLSVGRIHPEAKRLPSAVSLVSALREVSGQPWSLHLVGEYDSSCEDAGKAFIKSIENIPWISYHGYVENSVLAEWYRRATAVVFLSEHEGFGFPVAEADSFDRWTIVSQANRACLETGSKVLIPVEPSNSKEAALKVLHTLDRGKAFDNSQQQQSWRATAKLYAELISELL